MDWFSIYRREIQGATRKNTHTVYMSVPLVLKVLTHFVLPPNPRPDSVISVSGRMGLTGSDIRSWIDLVMSRWKRELRRPAENREAIQSMLPFMGCLFLVVNAHPLLLIRVLISLRTPLRSRAGLPFRSRLPSCIHLLAVPGQGI